jgi:hypothetical protein
MVIFCRTAKQLKRAIIDNFCIAIEVHDSDGEIIRTLGEPMIPVELERSETKGADNQSQFQAERR